VLGLLLSIFNHGLALSMGRLGVDSITVVLHCLAVAMWQSHRPVPLIWLCAVAAFNRANFVVLAVGMGVHVLVCQRPTEPRGEVPPHTAVAAAAACADGVCLACREFHAVEGGRCSVCARQHRERVRAEQQYILLFPPLHTPAGWFAFLLFHAVVAVTCVGALMCLTDSLWCVSFFLARLCASQIRSGGSLSLIYYIIHS